MILMENLKERGTGRPRFRWGDNITVDHKDV
jgi:hypothetical protein